MARNMSTTLKIGIWGGWLTSQLEKKFKHLYPYRNIWTHGIQFINANNCHASVNVFTIYSIFWIWMSRIGPASRNKIFVFCCKYLAFFAKLLALKINAKNWHFTADWETNNCDTNFLTYWIMFQKWSWNLHDSAHRFFLKLLRCVHITLYFSNYHEAYNFTCKLP